MFSPAATLGANLYFWRQRFAPSREIILLIISYHSTFYPAALYKFSNQLICCGDTPIYWSLFKLMTVSSLPPHRLPPGCDNWQQRNWHSKRLDGIVNHALSKHHFFWHVTGWVDERKAGCSDGSL